MSVVRDGLFTGLMGYSLKKEFLGDALYFRQTETFEYMVYATSMTGWSPTAIQNTIKSEFAAKSGNINVRMMQAPASYQFPNDSIRASQYKIAVEVRSAPASGLQNQAELTSNYYQGIGTSFFSNNASDLQDIKEGFSFEDGENGNQIFSHDLSFGLRTGDRNKAISIATGVFGGDKDTTFGISAMVGRGAIVANSGSYLNYYTESYDEIRKSYRFSRKREILPFTGASAVSEWIHTLDTKEDGTTDVSERGVVKGNLNFSQAQIACESLIGGAYGRCSGFYTGYRDSTITSSLVSSPTRISRNFNRQAISADYEVSFTNNPQFTTTGTVKEEMFDFNVSDANISTLKHRLDYTIFRRRSSATFEGLFMEATGTSPVTCANYYTAFNGNDFYRADWPMKLIKTDFSWPQRKNKGSISFEYSNHPKYYVTFEGIQFRYLDHSVTLTLPVDIMTEYKIINRPSQISVVNYSYQTEKGQVAVSLEAGLGRNPDEFNHAFRSNYGAILATVYRYGVNVFMAQFQNVIPVSFTYFLSDVKYSMNQDGVITMNLVFSYTLKKYML